MSRMLRRLGWEPHGASNTAEVGQILLEHGDRITVALVDLGLGREDGSDVARCIWRTQPELPIVMMSGGDVFECEQAVVGLPVVGFLSKPFEPASMNDLLRDVARTEMVRSAG